MALLDSLAPGSRALLLSLVVPCLGCGGSEGASGAPPIRNVLLISIDTLRADHLGCYGYELPTSPHLDALAAGGRLFRRAYSTSSWTLPSLTSILTSLQPATHDCLNDTTYLSADVETLAERLSAAGFATGAVTSHVFMQRKYALDQGFELYDDELVHEDLKSSHLEVSSPAISEKGIAWLEARAAEDPGRRWLLWLHYFDPHAAYFMHPDYLDMKGPKTPMKRYDSEIAWTDHHISLVLARLEELGFADDTVVVVIADHGEEFHDHGDTGHRRTLYEEVVRVPLIVRAPGFPTGEWSEPVSCIDVAPTLYELLDVAPPALLQGHSLVPALRGEPFSRPPTLSELGRAGKGKSLAAVVDGRWKLVRNYVDGSEELYDIEADAGEKVDVAAQHPEVVERLGALMQRMLETSWKEGEGLVGNYLKLSADDRETLKNLGYAGDDEDEEDGE